MAAAVEQAEAHRVLDLLQHMVLADPAATTTYGHIAVRLGRDPTRQGRFVGQVMSRIDLSCFHAGRPFISLIKVLKANGAVNKASFAGLWTDAFEQLLAAASAHSWTVDDFSRVRSELAALPEDSAKKLWTALERTQGQAAVRRALQFK